MKFIVLKLIRLYQRTAGSFPSSPLLLGSYSGCRSWPTCSEYAHDVIQQEGIYRGSKMAVARFIKCNPLWPAQRYG